MSQRYVGKFWKHYKGNFYYSYGLANHTETKPLQGLVVYRSLYAEAPFPMGQWWARPEAMWREPSPLDPSKPRFEPVEFGDLPEEARRAWEGISAAEKTIWQ